MGHTRAPGTEAGDLLGVRVDAVGDPDAVGTPAHALEELDRAAAVLGLAERFLVEDLCQVRVEPDVQSLRELRRRLHQLGRDRER